VHAAVIPIGGSHITNDLAISLQSSIDTAETVKIKFGHARPHEISRSEQIELNKIHPEEHGSFQRTAVAEVIEARLDELLDFIKAELVSIGLDGKLPAGVVLTGGSSRLSGLGGMVKDRLRLPVEVGENIEVQTIIDKVKEPTFAVSLGLVLMAAKGGNAKPGEEEEEAGALKKIQGWFKAFLP
jgi:cell division protein FtsA